MNRTVDTPAYDELSGTWSRMHHLGHLQALAGWDQMANMPPKEALYAKLLFLINAPAQRIATVINAVGRNVAVVIDQGVQNNKFAA